jgi:Fe-S cluster assembly protein SufD
MTVATATPEVRAGETTAPWLAEHERFLRGLPAGDPAAGDPAADEPAPLHALRQLGIERFAALGFPTLRQEEWRFTNVAPIARGSFVRPSQETEVDPARLTPHDFEAVARLVFVDGRFSEKLSQVGALPAGTVVSGLAQALAKTPELVLAHLGQHARIGGHRDHPFVALNTAFLQDGAFVHVPRGAVVEGTVHLLFLSSGPAEGAGTPTFSFPRNLIVAGENSQVTVVETYAGEGAYFCCPVTELFSGPSAVVDHYKLQRESRDAFHIATFQIEGERGSAPSSHSISIGGGLVRNDVNAVLAGEGIDCILNGLYLAEGRQLIDNHMRVEHASPHCGSPELYKGILDGKARAVFNGLIHVHPGAQKTDAKQSNRNLLLSSEAIANSNPQLEIFADDVKCTHGSTVGQLDEDAIFYLRSRGIGAEAASSLLTYAFASDIVERIKVEPVRRDLEEFLFARLPQGEVVRQAV